MVNIAKCQILWRERVKAWKEKTVMVKQNERSWPARCCAPDFVGKRLANLGGQFSVSLPLPSPFKKRDFNKVKILKKDADQNAQSQSLLSLTQC